MELIIQDGQTQGQQKHYQILLSLNQDLKQSIFLVHLKLSLYPLRIIIKST